MYVGSSPSPGPLTIPSLTLLPFGYERSIITRLPDPSGLSLVISSEIWVQGLKGGAVKGPKRACLESSLVINLSTALAFLRAEEWLTDDDVGGWLREYTTGQPNLRKSVISASW